MNYKSKLLVVVLACQFMRVDVFAQPTEKWGDQGNETYFNPVLPGDYSDIDAIRVGDDFYAISSTMQFSPGMAVLHSKDLVNWQIIGHAVADLTKINPSLNWDKMNSYGKGIWAGSIRYYRNKFWIYFGTPDDGFFMTTATDPAGPWEPLHQVWKVSGWDDCCPFWDDDGQPYFIATNFSKDPKSHQTYNIHIFRMTPDGKKLLPESDTIIHRSEGSEANKLYKINGLYYHFFSEVKSEGRVIMMERSKNIYGPWEIKQLNHVDKKKDKEPNQGGLIELPGGKWYFFTHHGSGDWEGRAASLLSVTWISGWPVIGIPGKDSIGTMAWSGTKPVQVSGSQAQLYSNEDFSSATLAPQFEWNYQPRADKWSLSDRNGFLRLYAFQPIRPADKRDILLRAGNTITQRSLRTSVNTVTVKMDISSMADGEYAGLTHFSTTSSNCIGVKQYGNSRYLVCNFQDQDSPGIKIDSPVVWLRSSWDFDGKNIYSYSLDGLSYSNIGDSALLTWGSYRGDRVGVFNFNTKSDSGFVDIDFFHYKYSR